MKKLDWPLCFSSVAQVELSFTDAIFKVLKNFNNGWHYNGFDNSIVQGKTCLYRHCFTYSYQTALTTLKYRLENKVWDWDFWQERVFHRLAVHDKIHWTCQLCRKALTKWTCFLLKPVSTEAYTKENDKSTIVVNQTQKNQLKVVALLNIK